MKVLKNNILLFVFVLMFFIPAATNNYTQYIVNMILVYILVTLGFNLMIGYVGRFSFASASFLGIGAYVTGLSMVKFNMPFYLSLPLSSFITAIVGLLIGFPALRLHKYYLAIVTVAFTSLMRFIYIHGGDLTFGPSGFDIPYPKLFGWVITTDKQVYYIVLIVFALIFALTKTLIQSKLGRAFIAVKESDEAAEALSINSRRTVLIAFALSGFIIGTAGGLFSLAIRRITPDSFGMHELVLHFIMAVLGGIGSITGSIIGAIVIITLPEYMRFILEYQEFIYGMIIVLLVLFAPQGVYGFIIRYLPGVSHEKLYAPNIR